MGTGITPVIDTSFLRVSYEGEALNVESINAKELANYLTSLQELFEAVNDEISDGRSEVEIQVKTLEYGSIHLNYEILLHNAASALDFFGSQKVSGAINMITLVGSLFEIIKRLKGKVINKIHLIDENLARFEIEGKEYTASSDAFDLYKNLVVRKKARDFVSALENEGYSEIHYVTNQQDIKITKRDLPFFELDDDVNDSLLDSENEIVVTITSLVFEKGKKWQVSDGQKAYKVLISDKSFLKKVDMNEAFRKNDMLRVKMLTRQWKESGKLKISYEVVKVLEHIPANNSQDIDQLYLDFRVGF